jgi:hypothetical protein
MQTLGGGGLKRPRPNLGCSATAENKDNFTSIKGTPMPIAFLHLQNRHCTSNSIPPVRRYEQQQGTRAGVSAFHLTQFNIDIRLEY